MNTSNTQYSQCLNCEKLAGELKFLTVEAQPKL